MPRRRDNSVTVTYADGTTEVVKHGELLRRHKRPTRRTRYQRYLHSPHWLRVRKLALKRDGRCVRCASTDRLEVHHKTYERLGREELADVETLCRACHKAEHGRAA